MKHEVIKPDARFLDMNCMRILSAMADAEESLSGSRSYRSIRRRLGMSLDGDERGRSQFDSNVAKLELWGYIEVGRDASDGTVRLLPKGWKIIQRTPPMWVQP